MSVHKQQGKAQQERKMSKVNQVDELLQLSDDIVSIQRALSHLTVALQSSVDKLHDLAEEINEEQYEELSK